ncbi:MAG: AAA family ATPase [Thaumarchaeota archaeon]|nr:AAA family ATPase [Nitrososphaerota archaeon]MCL7386107.1 AAA family ATPase [Candidatus Wolframiiraptor allenii]
MASDEKSAGALEEASKPTGTYIREVILENFMSHEYSRVTLSPGLNVITGPNGAGKSSILLGIAVALGQTYTDRAGKLSDLIRRGEKAARLTVVFDNTEVDGKRPIPWLQSDQLVITRYLKRTGEYWHYVNNRLKTKAEVDHLLRRLGINPNNMLIIMHQNMIEEFASKNNIEKLRMVEDAVGASQFRQRIVEAEARLRDIEAQEKSLKRALEEARAAVEYWKEQYEKLMMKRRLEEEKRRLELEYAWALVSEAEASANKLRERIEALMLEEKKLLGEIEYHEGEVERIRRKLLDLVDAIKRGELVNLEGFGKDLDILLEEKGLAEVAKYKLQENRSEQRRLGYELNRIEKDLAEKLRNASTLGERVKSSRKPSEILEDIRAIGLQIASLGEVFEEAEDMYLVADARYRETEQRSMELEENLKKAMEELEYRKELWRRFLRELVKDVEPKFNSILSIVDGRGSIVLRNLEDPEKASIELHVGFRGAEPVILDAQTHSGGERIVGTLAFLLALQRYIKSPFRAVDEFDVHLDPLNRERMIKLLMNVAEQEPRSQYIIITPGKIPVKEGVNVILVQNVGGKSMIGRPE